MARHDRKTDKARSAGEQPRKGRTAPGSHGERGSQGERYRKKDMGAHPAFGKQVGASKGKEEDYGSRGLRRRAGTTKREGFEDRGIGHAEDHDARCEAKVFKGKAEARRGRKVVMNQAVQEREAASRNGRSRKVRGRPEGYAEVTDDSESGGDLDISPGVAGGSKRSKRNPASR